MLSPSICASIDATTTTTEADFITVDTTITTEVPSTPTQPFITKDTLVTPKDQGPTSTVVDDGKGGIGEGGKATPPVLGVNRTAASAGTIGGATVGSVIFVSIPILVSSVMCSIVVKRRLKKSDYNLPPKNAKDGQEMRSVEP